MSLRAHPALRFKTGGSRGRQHSLLQSDPRIRTVLQAMESNPGQTIQDLSCLVHLSSSRFSHLFKAETGLSLQSFLTSRRLEIALHLLYSTEMPIKEISYRAGYRHAPSFVRAFRNQFATSPSDYCDGQQFR